MDWWNKLNREILKTDLYSRSGTEVGVSKGALKLKEVNGDYVVVKTNKIRVPKISYVANCDRYLNYPELNRFVFGKLPKTWLIGNYQKIFRGYCKNDDIRHNASSGGVVTGSQSYLLANGLIDGAITLRSREDKPYLNEPIVASSTKEILSASQSKYCISPVNHVLADLPGKYKSLAYVGLPEQVSAIRKLQLLKHKSVKNIKYLFGLFYGETLHISAINSIMRAHGYNSLKDIKKIQFREGKWPGNLRVDLKNGKKISLRKFHANYLIPSHITSYSFYQIDYTNELADISVGDAWSPDYESRGKGWSVIIARSPRGLQLLEKMKNDNVLYLDEISEKDLIEMHSHGLDLKKRGAFIRIEKRKSKGLPVPEYGYKPTNIPFKRKLFELILNVLFRVFKLRFIIYILEKIPPNLTGAIFVVARNIWKKQTKSTKKGGLENLKFKLT